jgi:hypothetical protein
MRKHVVGKVTTVWYWSRTVIVDIFLIYNLAKKTFSAGAAKDIGDILHTE